MDCDPFPFFELDSSRRRWKLVLVGSVFRDIKSGTTSRKWLPTVFDPFFTQLLSDLDLVLAHMLSGSLGVFKTMA